MSEYIAIVAAVLSAIGAIYSAFSFKKRSKEVSDTYKKLISSYADLIGDVSSSSVSDLARVRQDLEKVITGATESLSHISGKEIHSSIKLLEKDDEKLSAVTFLRDRGSSPMREVFNIKYPVEENTPYSELLNKLDKEHMYFLSNDLTRMEEGGYFYRGSNNKDWENLYKSVLVVPIQGKNKEEILGFLTFDSKDKSAFTEDNVFFASSISKVISAALMKIFSSRASSTHNEQNQNA